MATSRLSLKISAPIILVSALALGLTVFLNVGKLERTLGEVEESRLRFTINELRANLETGLDLGLTIKGLGNAEAALDEEVRRDPDILSISVIDTSGTVVFKSGPAAPAPQGELALIQGREWKTRGDGSIALGTKLQNNFGKTAGALVLRYSVRKQDSMLAQIVGELTLAAVCAVVLTALALMFGIHALVRRMNRTLDSMERGLGAKVQLDGSNRHAAALVEQVNLTAATALHDLQAAADKGAR